MITLLIIFGWFMLGFFAARIAYYDIEDKGVTWVMFFFGPLGWGISMLSASGNRRKAHFMPESLNFPPFRFLKNKFGDDAITKMMFGIRS